MRSPLTLFLFLLALILGGLALVFTGSEYRAAIFGTPPVSPGNTLFKVEDLDQVRQITLTTYDKESVSFKINGNIWEATTPWKDRADPVFMKFLIQFTARLKVEEVIPRKGCDLTESGLREGRVQVTMRDASGNVICDYRIGRPTAWRIPSDDGKSTQPTIFIRLATKGLKNNIYICSEPTADKIHALFRDQFSRFRDHHPFYFSPRFLDRVRIQNDDGEVVLSRANLRSAWQITKPLKLRVDPSAIARLFNDLARLTAIKVEDRANVTLPTAEDDTAQAREIAIHFAGAQDEVTLRIYPPAKEGESVVLATVSDRPDTVFHLPLTPAAGIPGTTTLSQLQAGVNDLRSKTMTYLNGPQLQTIIVRPYGKPMTILQRTRSSTWKVLRRHGLVAANQNALIKLIMAVTRDKVLKFVTDAATDLKPYGLHIPFLQIYFKSYAGEKMRIAFGRDPSGKNIYAHIVGRPNIWQISNETLEKIATNPWQWRSAHVWHIPKVDIGTITIIRKGHPVVELNHNFFSEQWKAKRDGKDATAALNPHRANKFLSHIESLTTTRWLGPLHPQAIKSLKNPNTIIRIQVKRVDAQGRDADPIVKTLKIGHTQGGIIYFGKVETTPAGPENEDENSFFLLSPQTIKQLYVDLFE